MTCRMNYGSDARHEEQNSNLNEDEESVNAEGKMMKTIKGENFDEIEKFITPRNFQECTSSSLRVAMEVSFKLREKAKRKGPDNERFHHLANSVEEFVFCFLDPLRPRAKKKERQQFGEYVLDGIFHDAVDFQQKKFFTHPVVLEEMHRKWHGFDTELEKWSWKALVSIVCVFDLFFSLLLFGGLSLLNKLREKGPINAAQKERSKTSIGQCYLKNLKIPYLIFVRDTLSYIVLLGLQCVLCVVPSTIKFNKLEWVILVFFFGRLLVECKQFVGTRRRLKQRRADGRTESCITCKALQIYFGDCWNALDFVILLFYSIIFMMKFYVVVWSRQVRNNSVLMIFSLLYGANVLCLSVRVFGHVVEQFQGVGTIQIALFSIVRDTSVMFAHFFAATVSFSFALTKVYVDKRSFGDGDAHDHACMSKSGISCWWTILVDLVLSIIGIPAFNPMDLSMDTLLDTVLLVKYAIFLALGIIFLKNMLISVMSHTYQQTKDNSIQKWAYQRAHTIEKYNDYDPIPVPLNIIYFLGECIKCMYNKSISCTEESPQSCQNLIEKTIIDDLEAEYFAKYRNSFPRTGEKELARLQDETQRSKKMTMQNICSSFKSQENDHGIPLRGPKAWSFDSDVIHVEGHLMSCKCICRPIKPCRPEMCYHGAKYYLPLCSSFPYFEVTILETGRTHWPGIGVVPNSYKKTKMPGWRMGSLGYHTGSGKIFHGWDTCFDYFDHDTKGNRIARRGDLICCTAMFEHQADGRVPICFTLNGEKIVTIGEQDQTNPTSSFPVPCSSLYPFLALSDGCSVLVKIYSKEKEESKMTTFAEIRKELEETNLKFEETNHKLDTIMGFIADLKQRESFPIA